MSGGIALEDEEELDPGDEFQAEEEIVGVMLRPSGAIAEGDITDFRGTVPTRTIILIGEQKAGKTTLLASLYGMFCKGPVGRFTFAGSRTLLAFAERHHLALEKSKRKTPTSPRTSRGEPVSFFHLALADGDERYNLVISDRSGEAFDDARKNTELISKLTELPLADYVCFLLSAGKLTTLETRASYKRTFRETIRALVDNDAIPTTAKVEVLITKIDKLQRRDVDVSVANDIKDYEAELKVEFEERFNSFAIHEICAMPRAKLSVGIVGLEQMIERWCQPAPMNDVSPNPVADADRFADRLLDIWGSSK